MAFTCTSCVIHSNMSGRCSSYDEYSFFHQPEGMSWAEQAEFADLLEKHKEDIERFLAGEDQCAEEVKPVAPEAVKPASKRRSRRAFKPLSVTVVFNKPESVVAKPSVVVDKQCLPAPPTEKVVRRVCRRLTVDHHDENGEAVYLDTCCVKKCTFHHPCRAPKEPQWPAIQAC